MIDSHVMVYPVAFQWLPDYLVVMKDKLAPGVHILTSWPSPVESAPDSFIVIRDDGLSRESMVTSNQAVGLLSSAPGRAASFQLAQNLAAVIEFAQYAHIGPVVSVQDIEGPTRVEDGTYPDLMMITAHILVTGHQF